MLVMLEKGSGFEGPENIPYRSHCLSSAHVALCRGLVNFSSSCQWCFHLELASFLSNFPPNTCLLCLRWATREKQSPAWKPAHTLVSSPRVLLENVEDLIRQQTSNDTISPRASYSYYEQYHSLNEVSCHVSLQNSCFH